jgi:hypothetical protein
MRVLVFAVNVVAWPINWWMSRADRNVCRWVEQTGDDT